MSLIVGEHPLDLAELVAVARGRTPTALGPTARARMARSAAWIDDCLRNDRRVYGVTTGFGSLARVAIRPDQAAQLSLNLIRSHAAGVGEDCPTDIVRAMMLLRANALALGASGCRILIPERLLAMLDAGLHPVVPRQGSCGSSGDLAPLSHLALVLFGEGGLAELDGERLPGPVASARAGFAKIDPAAKDGLALTNGAQLTTAITALALHDAQVLVEAAEVAAAMSIEALFGTTRAFRAEVHALRPHPGAIETAARLRALLAGSTLVDSHPEKVQDAYSLRCTPVVIGAARDVLRFGASTVNVEINAVTDNPVFLMDEPGDDKVFSAGLFHGEPVGMAADAMKMAIAEVASLSERRLFRLTTGTLSDRLPPGLAGVDRPELGMVVPQTTAAALVSENKALGWPMSMDSIPTCEDQEDHVAMSTTAAWRFREVVDNARRVVAIELLCAARALRFRAETLAGRFGAGAEANLPTILAGIDGHEVVGEQIEAIAQLIHDGRVR